MNFRRKTPCYIMAHRKDTGFFLGADIIMGWVTVGRKVHRLFKSNEVQLHFYLDPKLFPNPSAKAKGKREIKPKNLLAKEIISFVDLEERSKTWHESEIIDKAIKGGFDLRFGRKCFGIWKVKSPIFNKTSNKYIRGHWHIRFMKKVWFLGVVKWFQF